jgi:NAD(P)H-dependent flavin oxidoreductase YrpB (nitropropane dioxygenase family)
MGSCSVTLQGRFIYLKRGERIQMKTRITELFGIQHPILQGGLAHLAYADLAAAVSNAGGLGQITALSLETPEQLKQEIDKVRKLTNQPFGVNFAIGMGRRPYQEFLELAIAEEVPVISITGGNPTPVIERVAKTNIKTLTLIASVRQAQKAESLGVNAVIAVGYEGGGHLGRDDTSTMVLIPRVVDAVGIPVIASGGIGDARGLMAALSLGAEGIEMGTRFIATQECIAHPNYKQALTQFSETDTTVIKRSIGQPGRALKNKVTALITELESRGATYEDLKDYISGESNKKAIYEGRYEDAYSWAGQVVGLIQDVPSCKELITRMMDEAGSIRQRLRKLDEEGV